MAQHFTNPVLTPEREARYRYKGIMNDIERNYGNRKYKTWQRTDIRQNIPDEKIQEAFTASMLVNEHYKECEYKDSATC